MKVENEESGLRIPTIIKAVSSSYPTGTGIKIVCNRHNKNLWLLSYAISNKDVVVTICGSAGLGVPARSSGEAQALTTSLYW
jgi:hypothetical protein